MTTQESSAKNRAFRRKILITIVISSLIGLGLVEVLVRISGLDVPRVWEPDPELGWRHIPGATRQFTEEGNGWISINSLGLRDKERAVDKSTGVFRVMALGDSMTEADQVNGDENYSAVMERQLNRTDRPVEVLNFGVNGYSPLQELLVLRKEGPRYHPDLVTVGIFLDNDVSGSYPSLSTLAEQSPFAEIEGDRLKFDFSAAEHSYEDYHREPIYTIRKRSATYRWFRAARQLRSASAVPTGVPTRFMFYAEPCPPEWDEAWAVFECALLNLATEAQQIGAQFLIISLPCAQVVHEDCWNAILTANPAMQSRSWNLERADQRLKAFADKHHLAICEPKAALKSSATSERLFFGNVGHMTSRGHQIAGDAIVEFIQEKQLILESRQATAGNN